MHVYKQTWNACAERAERVKRMCSVCGMHAWNVRNACMESEELVRGTCRTRAWNVRNACAERAERANSGCTKTAAAREVEFESDQPILAWLLLLLTGMKEPPMR